MTILCVDDDPIYRDLYRAILEPKGFTVEIAANSAEGFSAVKKIKPDVMLLDVMMPESKGMFDGYGLLKKIRDTVGIKDTPIIMITGFDDAADQKHGLEEGASAYLPKQDLTPERLVKEIEKFL